MGHSKGPQLKVLFKARTPCVDVSEYWSLYENGSFGEKGELALVADRRVAFFLTFFALLVGFFATLDFLVFLAIAIPFFVPAAATNYLRPHQLAAIAA